MRKIMVSLLLVISMALPVFAQDTVEAPTQEVATLEATQTADVVTATASPTAEPTEEPAPVPEPSPIDQTKVFESVINLVIVLAVGIIAIAAVGITAAFFGLPPWAQRLVLSTAKTVVDEVDKVTDNPVANAGLAELRDYIAKLERELNEVKAQVRVNTSDIQTTAQKLG